MSKDVDRDWRERISSDPNVCHGQPCVKGTRVMAWIVLGNLAAGERVEDILASYPTLKVEDIEACLGYAAEIAQQIGEGPAAGRAFGLT